jgi:CBS-domain-containing membrane protein
MTSSSDFLKRLRGGDGSPPPRPATRQIATASIGGLLGIGLVGFLAQWTGNPWVLGSFGASCVMLFGYPDLPFSQPRHVIGAHVLSALIGLACLHWIGPAWWSMALAVGLTIGAMMAFRVVHPPAGSNPIIVFLGHAGWSFVVMPTLLGAVSLVAVALIYNNLTRTTGYPKYW